MKNITLLIGLALALGLATTASMATEVLSAEQQTATASPVRPIMKRPVMNRPGQRLVKPAGITHRRDLRRQAMRRLKHDLQQEAEQGNTGRDVLTTDLQGTIQARSQTISTVTNMVKKIKKKLNEIAHDIQ